MKYWFLVFAMAGCSPTGSSGEFATQQQAATVCADGPTIPGIDVSHWQSEIDWEQVADDGVEYAFIRVSHSTQTADRQFEANWRGARDAGILRGVYQYFEPGQDPVAQADYMVNVVGALEPGDLPPVIDVEATGGLGPSAIDDSVGLWIERVEEVWGVTPIIYTGKYFWQDHVSTTRFAGYPLWVAQYREGCPDLPSQWEDWVFWQTSSSGTVAGIEGRVDTDLFNGDMDALLALTVGEPICGDDVCHPGEEGVCLDDCPVCESVPLGGGVVDNGSPCFERFGPSEFWRYVEGEGVDGDLFWTHGFVADEPSNWARWSSTVDVSGVYRISASVHPEYAESRTAPWVVRHQAEETRLAVDLSSDPEWVVLGEFMLTEGVPWTVEVHDNSGDLDGQPRRIIADAVRLDRMDAPGPEPDPTPEPEETPDPEPTPEPESHGDGDDREPPVAEEPLYRVTRTSECSQGGQRGSWPWWRRR